MAERANIVLSKKDRMLYPEAKQYLLYSNQWIPLMEKCTLQEKISLGALLDKECDGGQIMHANVEGRFATKDQAWDLLNKIAKAGVIYFAFNGKISTCEKNHAFYGDICPKCGGRCTTKWTRVVGERTLECNCPMHQ